MINIKSCEKYRRYEEHEPRYSKKWEFWYTSREDYQYQVKRIKEVMEKQRIHVAKSYRKHREKRLTYNKKYNREHYGFSSRVTRSGI